MGFFITWLVLPDYKKSITKNSEHVVAGWGGLIDDKMKTWNLKKLLKRFRSSRSEMFCKKGVFRNFAKIHRKTPVPESLY